MRRVTELKADGPSQGIMRLRECSGRMKKAALTPEESIGHIRQRFGLIVAGERIWMDMDMDMVMVKGGREGRKCESALSG